MRNNDIILEQELKKIGSLIDYDRSKTLMEQGPPESVMDRRLGITSRNAKALGMTTQEYESKVFGMGSVPDLDLHDLLMGVEIAAMVIAPFTGPLAPIFLGVSIAAGLGDAAVYYFKDDDPHSAMIALALTVIPQVKLGKVLKNSKWYVNKYGRELTGELLEKYNKYKKGNTSLKFTDEELKFLREAGKDVVSESSQQIIKQEVKAVTKKGLLKNLSKKSLKVLVGMVYNILKYSGKTAKFIGTLGLQVGGVYITFDQLYLYLWGDDEYRQKSEFKQIADLVVEFSGDIKKWLIGLYGGAVDEMSDEQLVEYQEKILPVNEPIMTTSEYEEIEKNEYKNRQENLPGKKITLDDIRKGKSDLHYGDQGTSVKKIQNMLLKIGLNLGDGGADGFFGNDTRDAVEDFQTYPDDYGVEDIVMLKKVDGIIGRETLKSIEKAVKNKNNE